MALTANFIAQLAVPNFQGNLIVEIDGTQFSQYQPDSGLVIDADKLGIVNTISVSGVTLDLRKVNSPISNVGFSLLDKDGSISIFMGNSPNQLYNSSVKVYFGFITGSFDFSDYVLLANNKITDINQGDNQYLFTSTEIVDTLQTALLDARDQLDGAVLAADTTIDLLDVSFLPASGTVKIDEEFIAYTSITSNTLNGLSRGTLGGSGAGDDHDTGTEVLLVTTKVDNSMDMITDILINDLGVASGDIDLVSFSDLRDNDFSGEPDQTLHIYDVESGLEFIEDKLLASTNTRLFSVNGMITIGLLDQAPRADATTPVMDESVIQGKPRWGISGRRLTNKIRVFWNYSEGKAKFLSSKLFEDDDSIATYGPSKELKLNLFGFNDSSIAANRANRLLTRLKTPTPSIRVTTHLSTFGLNIADDVRLIHRHLPQQGSGLGFNDVLEVMSKKVNGLHFDSRITYSLEFTSYTGLRLGLIAPREVTTAITSQKSFSVSNGTAYDIGYRLRLYDNINKVFFAEAINQVDTVVGNIVTMQNDFVETLGTNTAVVFTTYDNASGGQRAKYMYTAPNTGLFAIDGSKAYQIIF